MNNQPTLESERLILRPLSLNDARQVQLLAGDPRIAETTANIPHPYTDGLAEAWISEHPQKWQNQEEAAFAIEEKSSQQLLGCISLMDMNKTEAEIGYWVAVEHWNKGFATGACKKIVQFAFGTMSLCRVHAGCLSKNIASERVLINAGLSKTGLVDPARCAKTGDLIHYFEKSVT